MKKVDTGRGKYLGANHLVRMSLAIFAFALFILLSGNISEASSLAAGATGDNFGTNGKNSGFVRSAKSGCDVFPRETPDGVVDALDVGQLRRFQLGFENPHSIDELQRADCASENGGGNGAVDALDVGQARQFQLTFDGNQAANEIETKSETGESENAKDEVTAPREVRVVTQTATVGSTITVVLQADAMGDESIYGFSLNYTTSVLTYVPSSVMIGSGATRQAGGMCNVLENANTAGRIGFSVDCSNSTITAGNNRPLVMLQFTVASNAATGSTPLTFGDAPAIRSVSSNPASGPVMNLPTTFTNGAVNIGSTRTVRVLSQDSSRNATITVVLEADAMGDESIYGFSLNYNSAILTYIPSSVMIGSGATRQPNGMCDVLENANTVGRIGFSVDCSNGTITAGNNRQFVTLRFTVASNAPLGQTPLEFGNTPARQSVSSNPAAGPIRALPTVFVDGFVNILVPTAASVSISGKVSTARGGTIERTAVHLTDGSGRTRSVVTNSFGFYRFDSVAAGETYTVSVKHKEYQFAARLITVNEAIEDLDFTAEP